MWLARLGVVGAVRRVGEAGSAALAVVARTAAELLRGMLAIGADKEIEPRMGGELRDTRRRQHRLHIHRFDVVRVGDLGDIIPIENRSAFLVLPIRFFPYPAIIEVLGLGEAALHERAVILRQGLQVFTRVGGAVDAEVAGHTAVEARHVLEVVIDRDVVDRELLNLDGAGKRIDDGEGPDRVVDRPALGNGQLDLSIDAVIDLLEIGGRLRV
jgi:hypothetical protein